MAGRTPPASPTENIERLRVALKRLVDAVEGEAELGRRRLERRGYVAPNWDHPDVHDALDSAKAALAETPVST